MAVCFLFSTVHKQIHCNTYNYYVDDKFLRCRKLTSGLYAVQVERRNYALPSPVRVRRFALHITRRLHIGQ